MDLHPLKQPDEISQTSTFSLQQIQDASNKFHLPQLIQEKKKLKGILENYRTLIVQKEKEGDSIQAQELKEEMKGH